MRGANLESPVPLRTTCGAVAALQRKPGTGTIKPLYPVTGNSALCAAKPGKHHCQLQDKIYCNIQVSCVVWPQMRQHRRIFKSRYNNEARHSTIMACKPFGPMQTFITFCIYCFCALAQRPQSMISLISEAWPDPWQAACLPTCLLAFLPSWLVSRQQATQC